MKTSRFALRMLLPVLMVICASSAATPALAAKGDCGQPVTTGSKPTATDCLGILKAAVGQTVALCDSTPCICDVDGNGQITASDALRCLRNVIVGQPPLICSCGLPCTSAEIFSLLGSDLDTGWTGIAHDADVIEGASITFRGVRRCSNDNEICERDSDCDGGTCQLTCDCNGGDTECEITGPTHEKSCLTTLAACQTNADCVNNVACVHTFGPPLPLSSGGNPVCVVSVFDGEITGTADSATGEGAASLALRSRVFLGISIDQPCPRCGRLDQNPKVGDEFTCEGGQFNNAPCTVQGVSPDFGGTSRDCPPALQGSISGQGLSIRFREVTTGTLTKTAQLPCTGTQYLSHPSRGNGKCLDNNAACSSNADCMRCTGDPAVTCTSNAQCNGKGTCAEAPDQPITCGHWCHCGFCTTNNVQNPDLPCFDSSDCPADHTCNVGNASVQSAPNNPQKGSNECTADGFICGESQTERCSNTFYGRCSLEDFRNCVEGSDTCELNNAGECVLGFKQCFESRITRSGEPSPLGTYCRYSQQTCSNNGDCGSDGPCVEDSAVPTTVALFCAPQTNNPTINSAGGITGPGAVTFKSFVKVCRCGDGKIECDEECDDSNTVAGDGCDTGCRQE